MRPRVCAAIIRNNAILMVRHQHDGRTYWTLPGGGVQPDETFEQAVVREVFEETGLHGHVGRFLFEESYSEGTSYCFLVLVDGNQQPVFGSDPEEADLPENKRMLREVGWHPLEGMKNDKQVSKVLQSIS